MHDLEFESEKSRAMALVLLPQYRGSGLIGIRHAVAAHNPTDEIIRADRADAYQFVDADEVNSDAFDFFTREASSMSAAFFSELSNAIGANEAASFCETIAREWCEGVRDIGRPRQLRRSVYEYLQSINKGASASSLTQNAAQLEDVRGLLPAHAIEKILVLTGQFLYKYLHRWQQAHPEGLFMGSSDIYFGRGLSIGEPMDVSKPYKEWDYINSYSLAVSVREKFSADYHHSASSDTGVRVVISGDWHLFDDRVLFFAPFIPRMELRELELGVIPSSKSLPIFGQGLHAGIYEYVIDEKPLAD
jgi:hypothetical protein